MKTVLHLADTRSNVDQWLKARHTFSFADYYRRTHPLWRVAGTE